MVNAPPTKTPLLLVVDDEPLLRQILRRALELQGYRTLEASSGEACLNLCQVSLPDLILLDARMPGIDGFDCCQRLIQTLQGRCPPIFIITPLGDHLAIDRAFAAGATDCMSWPMHWSLLGHRIRRSLALWQTIYSLQQNPPLLDRYRERSAQNLRRFQFNTAQSVRP